MRRGLIDQPLVALALCLPLLIAQLLEIIGQSVPLRGNCVPDILESLSFSSFALPNNERPDIEWTNRANVLAGEAITMRLQRRKLEQMASRRPRPTMSVEVTASDRGDRSTMRPRLIRARPAD